MQFSAWEVVKSETGYNFPLMLSGNRDKFLLII